MTCTSPWRNCLSTRVYMRSMCKQWKNSWMTSVTLSRCVHTYVRVLRNNIHSHVWNNCISIGLIVLSFSWSCRMCTTVDVATVNWQIAMDHQYTVHTYVHLFIGLFLFGVWNWYAWLPESKHQKLACIVVTLDFQFDISLNCCRTYCIVIVPHSFIQKQG